jgi:aspartyl/asparaginyl beta-hydroxylase (cupin superfamily)
MHESEPFRCLGNSSVEKCREELERECHHWLAVESQFSRRKTLPLLWCAKDFEEKKIKRFRIPQDRGLMRETDALLRNLSRYIEGEPVRIFYAKLERGDGISEHVDNGDIFRVSHRCHLPVIAPKGIEFHCCGIIHRPIEGEWFVLDNCCMHAVINRASKERIHLVIDLIRPDYRHLLDR